MTITAAVDEKVTCKRCGSKRASHNTRDGYCFTKQVRCYWENQHEKELAESDRRRKAEREEVEKAMDAAMLELGDEILPLVLADGRRVYSGPSGGHRAVLGDSDAVCLKLQGVSVGQVQRVAAVVKAGKERLGENQLALIAKADEPISDEELAACNAILGGDISDPEIVTVIAENQWQDDARYVDAATLDGLAMLRGLEGACGTSLHAVFEQATKAAPADMELRQMFLKLSQALDLLGVRR